MTENKEFILISFKKMAQVGIVANGYFLVNVDEFDFTNLTNNYYHIQRLIIYMRDVNINQAKL